MASHSEKEDIVRAALEVVYGATEPVNVWMPLLFPLDGNFSAGIAQRVFPIFFCCLRDLADAPERHLRVHAGKAESMGFEFLAQNIKEIGHQCSYALDVIKDVPIHEQVYISLIRDRLVHGYLGGTTNPQRSFRVATKEGVKQVKFSKEQQEKIVEEVNGEAKSHAAILRIFEQVRPALFRYLEGVRELSVDIDVLRQALMSDAIVYFEGRSTYTRAKRD